MIDRTGRTIISSVVFLDIVSYSTESNARQLAMKTALNDVIAEALAGMSDDERIVLDTGDGAALCFLGDPEDAMFIAGAIRLQTSELTGDASQVLRIGINLGPIKVITDFSGHTNVVGDGINVAQRIMSFADDGEVLVSRSYYEVVACLQDNNQRMFRNLGVVHDKHVREHQVYALNLAGDTDEGEASTSLMDRLEISSDQTNIDQERLEKIQTRLTALVGPVANTLIERALKTSSDIDTLVKEVSSSITDDGDRALFLAEFGNGAKADETAPAKTPDKETKVLTLDEGTRTELEKHLSYHMGPIAKVLIQKLSKDAGSLEELCDALASHIENAQARQNFLDTVRKAASAQ